MGDKRLISHDSAMTKIMHTDPHAPGRQVFQSIFHDDAALEQNKKLRNSGLMKRGDILPIVDASVSYAFSFPSVERYAQIQQQYPDIFEALRSKDQRIREDAGRRLALLHPEFCTLSE